MLGGSTSRPSGWAAELRFRQNASLVRVSGTVDFAPTVKDLADRFMDPKAKNKPSTVL